MPKKRDEGHEETEAVLKDLEKRINKEYAQAEKELQAKVDDYMRRFKIKDDIKRNAVANGKLDKKEYQDWLTGQLAIGKRWEEMKDSIARDLTQTAQIAKGIASGYMPDVYAINHNYGTFQVEKASKVDTSYTLYDRDAVNRMFKDTDFYKKPGRKVQRAINEGKQMAWDKKQIQSMMFQGIAQGESVGQIATRICKQTCDSDRKAAIRNARTMTTGVQNAGRVDSYKRAEGMGIKLQQMWLATLDDRTRHEHRQLDGMKVAVGDSFHVDGEEKTYDIEYPGDPSADPEMVYNCRCTLVPALEGFEYDMSDRMKADIGGMSYDEWKDSHEERSDPITKQDDISKMMQESYIKDYKYLAGQNPYIPNKEEEAQDFTESVRDIPEDVEETIEDFMDKFKDAKTEHYLSMDKDGNIIFESGKGGKTSVTVPKYIDEQMEGGYSVHNHPAKAVYSPEDIKNYEKYGSHGFLIDNSGDKYELYNTNPVAKFKEVENAKTEDEVRVLLPFSTAYEAEFNRIDGEIAEQRRAYGKELLETVKDPRERSQLMREWMKEHDSEAMKISWLEENAKNYGFLFKRRKYGKG